MGLDSDGFFGLLFKAGGGAVVMASNILRLEFKKNKTTDYI